MTLDMRTILLSNVITDVVCTLVLLQLWHQSRKRFAGTGFWVLDLALQLAALILVVLRGDIPDWMSMVVSNTLIVAGAVLGYIGLERFVGKRTSQVHNLALLVAFACVHAYFAFVRPNLTARNLNISLGLLIIAGQCVWLLLHRVEPAMRRFTRGVGIVFAAHCLVSVARIAALLLGSNTATDYLQSGLVEALALLGYQMLFVFLTYSLVLMVSQRLLAEVQTQEDKFSKAFHSSPYVMTLTRLSDGQIMEVNDSFVNITGHQRAEAIGKTTLALHLWDVEEDRAALVKELSETGRVHQREVTYRKQSGETITGLFSTETITLNGERCILSSISDITERKRAEEEREKLQAQLHQAQKIESVGRLAGGVAHELNNMLSVILGHAELAQEQVDLAQPLFARLQAIRKAAERAANLTRQLLAFASKQIVAPKVLDLNGIIEGMLTMLRPLMGEDIALSWLPAADLWPVRMDPSQIDQILVNLSVNAREAITGVGRVSIETRNVVFDAGFCAKHAGSAPGEHVLLAVSDDGRGMDRETLGHLFEPFFTTKGVGQGAGLGLATVYGIVKQNGGFIDVYSEPGKGTTFNVYLPCHAAEAEQIRKEIPAAQPARAHETILLVEDEPAILKMTTTMLERLGYRVLAASTPGEAMRVAKQHPGEIHLLMTDVVMPEMNGRDLAGNLTSLRRGLKCLFMSGYPANVIANRGVLDEGAHFIQKPFLMLDLATRVREVLDGK